MTVRMSTLIVTLMLVIPVRPAYFTIPPTPGRSFPTPPSCQNTSNVMAISPQRWERSPMVGLLRRYAVMRSSTFGK